jgi:mannose-1-phosphate guanylyltransferase / mannose-6-phosphate isomerase
MHVTPVILCGGSGARLWPLSRSGFPKQFLCLTGDESLFQQTARRLAGLDMPEIEVADPLIVTGEEHRFLAAEQLREGNLELGAALLEPVGRNTAPALTLAAFAAQENGDDPILVVAPADQSIVDGATFTQTMQAAIYEASNDSIVTLGVTPSRPETGYGYIQTNLDPESSCLDVRKFVEKPDASKAQIYLSEGGCYWNSGIFVLKASVWLSALNSFRPDIAEASELAWSKRSLDDVMGGFIRPGKEEFAAIPSESIDYAVMENCPDSNVEIKMIPLEASWSDLGAWDSVWNIFSKDSNGNAFVGDAISIDSKNTLVYTSNRLVGVVGIENLVVVETADAVLVADKGRSQEVKQIVNALNQQQREEHTLHRKVSRPWGWYDSIDECDHSKVKRIHINPKASLSLQKHYYRAEHWVVIKGTAEIICDGDTVFLGENQSTYIPLGKTHRITNPGTIPLEIIEIQSGSYLGEDDIVRFEDCYGRGEE